MTQGLVVATCQPLYFLELHIDPNDTFVIAITIDRPCVAGIAQGIIHYQVNEPVGWRDE